MKTHTLSVLVLNNPGVLTRIAALFSRRGFNIESLAVGPTERTDMSRMTVVAAVDDDLVLEQLVKQLNKLVEVIKVLELGDASVRRELVLIKVRSDVENRSRIVDTIELFRGKTVDVDHESLTVEATGSREKLDALINMLEPFGILELVQSGQVAVARGCAHHQTSAPARIAYPARPQLIVRRRRPAPAQPLHTPVASHSSQTYRRQHMATMFYDDDADLSIIQGRTVAVIGFGSQGHAHALNLRDSGVDVRVGLPEASKSRAKAEAQGLRVLSPAEATAEADLIMILAPDQHQRKLYAESIEPNLQDGDALFFAHGFNIRFGYITAARRRRRVHGRPEGPGPPGASRVRRRPRRPGDRRGGAGRHAARPGRWRSATPRASVACAPAASRPPSPRRPRPTCSASRPCCAAACRRWSQSGFETLVDAGYQPEVAYFECLHEMKLIVDLMYEGGIAKQRWSVSDTAEFGDYVSGPRIIDQHVKDSMKAVLADIQSGAFAKRFIDDQDAGAPEFKRLRAEGEQHPIEATGRELRKLMAWVKSSDSDYVEGTASR